MSESDQGSPPTRDKAWGGRFEKPADPKLAWDPEWNVRVRTKSTAMAMLGMDMSAAAQREDAGEAEEPARPVKSLLRGLLGH